MIKQGLLWQICLPLTVATRYPASHSHTGVVPDQLPVEVYTPDNQTRATSDGALSAHCVVSEIDLLVEASVAGYRTRPTLLAGHTK